MIVNFKFENGPLDGEFEFEENDLNLNQINKEYCDLNNLMQALFDAEQKLAINIGLNQILNKEFNFDYWNKENLELVQNMFNEKGLETNLNEIKSDALDKEIEIIYELENKRNKILESFTEKQFISAFYEFTNGGQIGKCSCGVSPNAMFYFILQGPVNKGSWCGYYVVKSENLENVKYIVAEYFNSNMIKKRKKTIPNG